MAKIKTTNSPGIAKSLKDFIYNPGALARRTQGMSADDAAAYTNLFNAASESPLGGKLNVAGEVVDNTGFGTTTGLLWDKVKAHPIKSAGLGLLGGMNIAGLFDNDKLGGQVIGTGAGIATPFLLSKLGMNLGIPGRTASALIGGGLGSLFDKLMAKKEQEEQMVQQYQGQY